MRVLDLQGEHLAHWVARALIVSGNDEFNDPFAGIEVEEYPGGGWKAAWAKDPTDLSKGCCITWAETPERAVRLCLIESVFGPEVQDQ